MRRFGRYLLAILLVLLLPGATRVAAAEPTLAWSALHDGGALFNDDGWLVAVAPDGQPVVAGESTEVTGGADLLVRKLDRTDGHQVWSYRYEGYDGKDVAVTDMTWDSVGQLLVAGFIRGCVG
jgi:hypothetical protein